MLKVTTPPDREIEMTRVFDAPRKLVFEALTRPELLRRWFHGSPGWTLAVVPPERVVQTEKSDVAWYPGEAVGTVTLAEADGKTTLAQRVKYESREARDAVMKTPATEGVSAGYDNLAGLLATPSAEATQ